MAASTNQYMLLCICNGLTLKFMSIRICVYLRVQCAYSVKQPHAQTK